MGHINLFNTFDEYKNDNNVLTPNVNYIESTEKLIYGKKTVLRCTFEVTEDDLIENNYNPITLINGINLYSKEYTINGETISCKPFELTTNSTDVSFEYNEELDGILPNEDVFLPISSLNTDYKIKVNREISENDLVFMALFIPEINLYEKQVIPVSDTPFLEKTNEELTYKLSVNLVDIMGDFPSSAKIAFVIVGEEIMNGDLNGLNLTKSITYTDYTLEDIVVYEPNIYEISFNYNLNTINFFQNYYLKSIIIPNSVTEISDGAFYECYKLSSIEIPKSIEYIGDYAFYYCSDLKKIKINSPIAPVLGNNVFGEIDDLNSLAGRNTYSLQINTLYLPMNHKDYDIDEQWFILLDKELCGFKIDGGNYNYGVDNSSHEYSIIYATYYMENDGICELFHVLNVLKSNVELNGNTAYLKKGYNDIYFIIDSNTDINYAFQSCKCLTSIEIPDSVTSIGDRAFFECTSLESIEIPNSVTSIGSYAFYACYNLTSIEIPNSVTSISDGAFEFCSSLTSIEIPNSVTSIGSYAFYACGSLTSIEIPNSVTSISNGAFYACNNLTSIEIPNSVTSIGDDAFEYCESLTSIEIPDSVTSIGDYSFLKCTSLTSITIGNSVTSIGDVAFQSCSSLISIEIPDSVTSIGDSAFYNCTSLTSVIIGNSVTSIGGSAFNSCSSLTSIDIPNSVTSIGDSAFYNCTSLTSIDIPTSVTSIGNYAFSYCNKLQTIVCRSLTAPSLDGYYVFGAGSYNYTGRDTYSLGVNKLYLPQGHSGYSGGEWDTLLDSTKCGFSIKTFGSNGNYGEDYYGDDYYDEDYYGEDTLPFEETPYYVTARYNGGDNVQLASEELLNENYNDEMFAGIAINGVPHYKLTATISSSDEVKIYFNEPTVGNLTFYSCKSLTSITIGNSVTSIGYNTFYSCSSLTSIEIPNSVTSIGDEAFYYCESLTSIDIPNSVTSIGKSVFRYCSSLVSIIVSDGNTVYDSRENCNCIIETATNTLIQGCKNSIIPNSVTSIGDSAFYYCTSLKSIEIPDSVTSIGDSAFYYCVNLTSITLGDSVTSIGNYAFSYCVNLTSITLGNSVTSIGNYAFKYCSSLTSIEIPNSVTSIGDSAFYYCTSLKSIEIPDSVTSIGNNAFTYCNKLQTIVCRSVTAPNLGRCVFGMSFSYTGQDTYSLGVNKLYLPQGHSGYSGGEWNTLLNSSKCGFSIEILTD